MKKIFLALFFILGFALSAHAQSYDVDFKNDVPNGADYPFWGGNERGIADGTILEFDGVYIKFSATSTDNENGGYAYFDGGAAGLGVCGTLSGDQCAPSSDDNLTSGETLTLSFFSDANAQNTHVVALGFLEFRDADHNVIDSYSHLLGINGNALTSTAMNAGWTDAGSVFTFGYDSQEYYISSMVVHNVPEPATWLMMVIGFGLVSSAARRRKHVSKSLV